MFQLNFDSSTFYNIAAFSVIDILVKFLRRYRLHPRNQMKAAALMANENKDAMLEDVANQVRKSSFAQYYFACFHLFTSLSIFHLT